LNGRALSEIGAGPGKLARPADVSDASHVETADRLSGPLWVAVMDDDAAGWFFCPGGKAYGWPMPPPRGALMRGYDAEADQRMSGYAIRVRGGGLQVDLGHAGVRLNSGGHDMPVAHIVEPWTN
jgi:hypothetical protein